MLLVQARRLIWTGILCVLLGSTSTNCVAAIGTITEQANTPASIQRSKTTLTGTKGTGVEMEDAVKTSQGKVGITFADDTKVQVNENSKLVIDDFVYDPKNKGAGKLALNMAGGTVRYASGAIAKNNPSKVAINTPTATIAVRGTDFTATVDELGASTIILLPSCVDKVKTVDQLDPKDKNCVTGVIDVITEAGTVTLDRPFQATRVESKSTSPTKPVTLNLSIDAMNGLLILSPPPELKKAQQEQRTASASMLEQNFLKEADLGNVLADQQREIFKSKLAQNFLEQEFLNNLLTLLNDQLNENLLKVADGLLPDYKATSGVKVSIDDLSVELCRNDGSNRQCVSVNKGENSTIIQQQGNITVKNRVNTGNGTLITLKQN
ncbi:FecR protein [uncultured Caudovirales phage]|uniref:FecR protein n=1 Tax=uncultured Caudovirales phage TaxID=2100421 RepID=A0A6J5L7L6_9CAUD|nr:FecR protein [uncultured Caudovirales phage]